MMRSPVRFFILAAAVAAAAALAGCGSDGSVTVPAAAPPAAAAPVNFSTYAKNAFAQQANSNPLPLPATLVFDVDDDPMAFSALLM